jgi:hypothetical protein
MSVEWAVQATEFANCNCAYGCGCQFNALPDKGLCEAVAGYQIRSPRDILGSPTGRSSRRRCVALAGPSP